MSGRRSHVRFQMMPAAQAQLRLMRDVTVQRVEGDEVIAVSREPGVIGEVITVEVPMHDANAGERRARIVESSPMTVEGNLRHRLRLKTMPDTVEAALQPVAVDGEWL